LPIGVESTNRGVELQNADFHSLQSTDGRLICNEFASACGFNRASARKRERRGSGFFLKAMTAT